MNKEESYLVDSETPLQTQRRNVSLFNLLKDKLNLNDGLESQEIRKKKKKRQLRGYSKKRTEVYYESEVGKEKSARHILENEPIVHFCLENPMDRGAWQKVQSVLRAGHDLVAKPPPPLGDNRKERSKKMMIFKML